MEFEGQKKFAFPKPVVGDEDIEYLMGTMRKICTEAGFRVPGSEAEKKGHQIFAQEYAKWADEVTEEKFTISPKAYPEGMIKPVGWFFLLTVLFYFILPVLAWIVLIPMFLWISELFMLKRWLDPFYSKAQSQNIIAKLHPTEEPKAIMVFTGHNDSPNVFPLTAKWRKGAQDATMLILVFDLIFIFLGIYRGIMSIKAGQIWCPGITEPVMWIGTVLGLIMGPITMWLTQNFISKKLCLGANDNLSGSVSALALARYFKEHRPKNIELWFVAFGSEEAGQRGATNFAITHKDELIRKGAYVVNLESIGGGNFFLLATGETMCIPHIKHHQDVYNLLKEASNRAYIRRQCVRSALTQGYTDAEALSRIGIKACSILGLMLDGFPMLWHIETDTPDAVRPSCMRDVMEVCVKAVELREEQIGSGDISSI